MGIRKKQEIRMLAALHGVKLKESFERKSPSRSSLDTQLQSLELRGYRIRSGKK